ncbi:hypothetical protein FRX31_024487 [Thalictrum thalictroides]|uniref:Secreted protein n=1 Tax=Thalictrum thalictroides TaxID=46969 RepID=A0A7J6VP09_THATH|nr:hypothetical protein FRX31_024487 [Thalictrum thalictroides]
MRLLMVVLSNCWRCFLGSSQMTMKRNGRKPEMRNQLGRRFWINTLKSMIGIQADMWWTASIQAACGGVQWFTYELHSQR